MGQHVKGRPARSAVLSQGGHPAPASGAGQGGTGATGIRGGSPASPSIALGALMFGKSKLLWDTIKDKFK